ncbi:hypothetical protein FHQ08_05135 [Lactobacillus sp. CC-MHH1034]|uniref:hypothetical protein n=1 Tax=Agrilactobacillus fermenti TaxID=2586909 RepID=UPI001E5643FA|nr:hypothetical protein [Agrilactobacillus fermenti]MCD2256099.1 hypothetical protein [Agrilactobacillus fermenti]
MLKNILVVFLIMISVWFISTLIVTTLQVIWAFLPFNNTKKQSFIKRFLNNSAWIPYLFIYALP